MNGHRPLTRAPHGPRPEVPFIDKDSCYGSSDEVSHASLSRESSDPEKTGSTSTLRANMDNGITDDLVTFTQQLGYSVDDLSTVMKTVSIEDKDQLMGALLKLGRPNEDRRGSTTQQPESSLRSIIIDGSNIAMTHGRKEVFSCQGIRSTVDFFVRRGHSDILVFIPQFRKESPRCDSPITDQHILFELDQEGKIVWTPSRNVNGRRVICHDDRYILKTATEKDGVVVSNDEYRDLLKENVQYKNLVENRQLMYSFVDGRFMPPDDPCGRNGPTLDRFLSKLPNLPGAQPCPYARKCTYGNKCKYYHPERANGGHQTVTERLFKENYKKTLSPRSSMQLESVRKHNSLGRTQSLNMNMPTENLEARPPIKRHLQLTAVNSAPWAVPHNQTPLGRMSSMPLSPLNQQQVRFDQSKVNPHSQLFAPSTAVWGHSELSVAPFSTSTHSDQEETSSRAHLQHHLCHLFPEAVVVAVMAANPLETNVDELCRLILAHRERTQKEFNGTAQ